MESEYTKFMEVVHNRKLYWRILWEEEIKGTLTLELIEEYTDKINECDEIILKNKKQFGYGPQDEVR